MEKYDALKLEKQLCFPLYAVSKEIVKKYKPYLDELDERVLIVTLTAEGEKLRDKAVEIPQKVGGCVCLDQEEAASLYKILYKILGNM